MFCSQCGTKLKEGAKFCQNCGAMVKGVASNSSSIEIEKVDKKTPPFKPDKINIAKVKFTEVIPPILEWVRPFGEGLAAIQDIGDSGNTSVLGFIDVNGNMKFEIDVKNASSFSEGLCAVCSRENSKWGFIDTEGELVIPYLYDDFDDITNAKFKNGYCVCKKDNTYVLIDKYGKEVDFSDYEEIEYYPKEGMVSVVKSLEKGLCDVYGTEIIQCTLPDYENFQFYDDVIKIGEKIFKRDGKEIKFEYNIISYHDIFDGLVTVEHNNLYGYCDTKGNLLIPCDYLEATEFCDGFAFVKNESGWQTIDRNNNVIATTNVGYFRFNNKFGRGTAEKVGNRKTGLVDKYFNEITEFKYDRTGFFVDNKYVSVSWIRIENKIYCGLINRNGKEILPCKYDDVSIDCDRSKYGVVSVIQNGKVAYIDINTGKELFTPGKYDRVLDFCDGYAIVKKGDKYGYISCLPNAKALKKEKIGASVIDGQYLKNKEKEEKKAMAEMERKKAANYMKDGSIVEFGIYQGYPIQWRVLKNVKTRGTALLISNNVLDFCSFDNSGYTTNTAGMGKIQRFIFDVTGGEEEIYTNDIVWADSYIRSWLNTKFFNNAFNGEEQQRILNTNINTTGKRSNRTRGGEDTADKVFLLSVEELKKYMYQGNDCIATYNGYPKVWWLRSPGMDNETVAAVNENGYIIMNKYHFANLGVRPVINIKI